MDADLTVYLTKAIPRAASKRARLSRSELGETGGLVSIEDIEQEMWAVALESETALAKHLKDSNEHAITTVLMSGAQRMIRGEVREQRTKKAVAEGYETYDEEFYSIGSLRQLVPMYLDGGVTERPPVGREQAGKVSGGSASYGDYLMTMTDIDAAFKALTVAKRKIVERYFAYPQGSGGWTHTEIASAMGMPPEQLSSRVHHALRAMQRTLGGESPWKEGKK